MKYRIATMEGTFEIEGTVALGSFMQGIGYAQGSPVQSPNLLLDGQPTFQGTKNGGMCGPFWDGDAVRYEDYKTYLQLSQ